MWHQPCQRCKYTTSADIQKRAINLKKEAIHSCRITCERSESAREAENSVNKSRIRAINNNNKLQSRTHALLVLTRLQDRGEERGSARPSSLKGREKEQSDDLLQANIILCILQLGERSSLKGRERAIRRSSPSQHKSVHPSFIRTIFLERTRECNQTIFWQPT